MIVLAFLAGAVAGFLFFVYLYRRALLEFEKKTKIFEKLMESKIDYERKMTALYGVNWRDVIAHRAPPPDKNDK